MTGAHLEDRTVSRKTPGDGKLEITKPVADRLAKVGSPLELETPDGVGSVELQSMPCTCRGGDKPHEHWFLASSLFTHLTPGTLVGLSLQGRRILVKQV